MSIFPFINPESTTTTELPIFQEYAFDYVDKCLKTVNGLTYLVEKNEALKIWIYKVLHTERYRYLAYSSSFGSEIESLIGKVNSTILEAEMKRFIIEAIMVNPYIKEISEFKFFTNGSEFEVEFLVTTIYGVIVFNTVYKGV